MNRIYVIMVILFLWGEQPVFSVKKAESVNLLLNSSFDFHSFVNHRDGIAISYTSNNVAFWNTDAWGDISVMRESHVSDTIRPPHSVHNLVSIKPGKRIYQFFTLPEAGLAHGDYLNFILSGYQPKSNMIKAKIKLLKLDSETGEWSPKTFGLKDDRTFPKHARGELVVAKEYLGTSSVKGSLILNIKKAKIIGKTSVGNKSNSTDINTIGVQIEIENTDSLENVWIYSPKLTSIRSSSLPELTSRVMTPYYRYIPRTIQKLWKGESLHIMIMGSSIDRGSGSPALYLYDENPKSSMFKTPISEWKFEGSKINRTDLDDYLGEWRHYFTYGSRLKLELMRKFNLSPSKICMNYMACDGSTVGEAHSGLEQYCNLSIEPHPELNGQKYGKSWKELYPELFSRSDGPRPDLIIFGSGANEKTDTPDEVAVFEGMIRWIQQHYPNTEFLFSQFQNKGGYTPNTGDLQALALRYQIPFLDFGKASDDIGRWCNNYTLVPIDGHPQAADHYLWFKQIEKAFECWDPIEPGQVQIQLPERVHSNTYNWEGDMITFDKTSRRINGNRFIFDDGAINCWGKVDTLKPAPYVDGIKIETRYSSPKRDIRNSMFRYGRCSLGERHILEITGKNPELTAVDAKVCPNRMFYGVENPHWELLTNSIDDFNSKWGAPYGSKKISLSQGKSIELEVICTDISVAYIDSLAGGILNIYVDNQLRLSQATNIPFVDSDRNLNYLENRKGILNLGYGLHRIRLEAKEGNAEVLGVFTYDSRSNRKNERQLVGTATGNETLEFSLPFKARPVVICTGGLSVLTQDITKNRVKFSGSRGSYQIIGE